MSEPPFAVGMDVLLEERRGLLRGRRVGLVCHTASLTADGSWSAARLWADPQIDLCCLFGPEHGVFGQAGAGERVGTMRHPAWDIPVYSLYGQDRSPTPEMLADLDVLVVDLQDLGVRCYTFCSTLALVLEAAARAGLPVIVADRPIPLPGVMDGPGLDPAFASFVALLAAPMVYGLTQAETALLLGHTRHPDLDLQVAAMQGYRGSCRRPAEGPPWVPPSTGIRSWETAWCYPATVFTEALPQLDCGRFGPLPFQLLGATWLRGTEVIAVLEERPLAGVRFHPHWYYPASPDGPRLVEGIRMTVTDPAAFRPVATGLRMLEAIQQLYGADRLWDDPAARPAFFDQLCGTDAVREGLQQGWSVQDLFTGWEDEHAAFRALCAPFRLYPS